MAVAGALAVTLVVAGTSGAIAGRLITSQDIKDGTIKTKDLKDNSVTNRKLAPGAVDWEKSLSADAKAQIEALIGEGGPGSQGPQGPRGPAGPQGPAGMGDLVFWDYFWSEGEVLSEEDPAYELEPAGGERIVLDEPGDYLVTMRGASLAEDEDDITAMFVGEPDGDEDLLFNACLPGALGFIGIPLLTCNTTYPLSVGAGAPLELPVLAAPFRFSPCDPDCEGAPALASVAIYKVDDTPTAEPGDPSCECDRLTRGLRRLERQLNVR